MKSRNFLFVTVLLLCSLMSKSQSPCPLTFTNMLGCQADVDITWQFYDCSAIPSPCGVSGSANIPFGGSFTIPCQFPACSPFPCDIVITLVAVNGGCQVNPASISWSAAQANNGKAFTVVNCAGVQCGNCCDGGNSIGIDILNGFAWVN